MRRPSRGCTHGTGKTLAWCRHWVKSRAHVRPGAPPTGAGARVAGTKACLSRSSSTSSLRCQGAAPQPSFSRPLRQGSRLRAKFRAQEEPARPPAPPGPPPLRRGSWEQLGVPGWLGQTEEFSSKPFSPPLRPWRLWGSEESGFRSKNLPSCCPGMGRAQRHVGHHPVPSWPLAGPHTHGHQGEGLPRSRAGWTPAPWMYSSSERVWGCVSGEGGSLGGETAKHRGNRSQRASSVGSGSAGRAGGRQETGRGAVAPEERGGPGCIWGRVEVSGSVWAPGSGLSSSGPSMQGRRLVGPRLSFP